MGRRWGAEAGLPGQGRQVVEAKVAPDPGVAGMLGTGTGPGASQGGKGESPPGVIWTGRRG